MPRKTKEQTKLEKEENVTKKSTKTTTKKASSKTTAKKVATKTKPATKKASTSSKTPKETKTTARKKSTTTSAKKSAKTKTKANKVEVVEYYDLPYRYNQTVVKVLAQTPNNLFVYWDISDYDRENYKKQFGDNFFETTKPVLIVHNKSLDYSFEVEINDFANSWYLHVSDSKCDYEIELGRRPIEKIENLNSNYVYVSSSNTVESPNDTIILDKNIKSVIFRNVKDNHEFSKSITDIKTAKNIGNIYNIYDLYKMIYKDENIYDNSNTSSSPSSHSFSSK